MMVLVAAAQLAAGTAPATSLNSGAHRFTLTCESQNPKAPIRSYFVDVNLERRSYYVDTQFGGLDEIDAISDSAIMLRRHGGDPHGLPVFTLNEYDRTNGHWYYTVGPDRRHHAGDRPDAICTMLPPREKFRADQGYDASNH